MTNIFIFNNASRAAGYGIGTYVRQLADGLRGMPDTKVSLVDMYADTKEFAISDDESGMRHYLIPPLNSNIETEEYCRIIYYFLARNIDVDVDDEIVFQFNYFQHYHLALLLKSWFFNSRIVLTVHYMSWCFALNGNVRRMREITAESYRPSDDIDKHVIARFSAESAFLHLADKVIALSKSTRDILVEDYKVSTGKIHLIYNGIDANACSDICKNKENKRTIIFVGRLEDNKGVKYLIDAFSQIADKHPDIILVIVGDGDFQPYMAQSRKLSERISFYGKMQKDEIEGVYQSAYIGVIPSFHEQCSYTGIEMMRYGIPVIGTDGIGLSEMLDATPELRVHIDEDNFNDEDFVSQMASRMNLLLSDENVYRFASDAVRAQFERRYTIDAMIEGVKNAVLTSLTINNTHVSPDYLPHIDEQMINLINKHPDIDMELYGISGIGVYLWWRVLQLDSAKTGNAYQLALIKEHLIYYLDWVEEVLEYEKLPNELTEVLLRMRKHSFYPTMVEKILKSHNSANDSNCQLTEQEILHNALRICTCKI